MERERETGIVAGAPTRKSMFLADWVSNGACSDVVPWLWSMKSGAAAWHVYGYEVVVCGLVELQKEAMSQVRKRLFRGLSHVFLGSAVVFTRIPLQWRSPQMPQVTFEACSCFDLYSILVIFFWIYWFCVKIFVSMRGIEKSKIFILLPKYFGNIQNKVQKT